MYAMTVSLKEYYFKGYWRSSFHSFYCTMALIYCTHQPILMRQRTSLDYHVSLLHGLLFQPLNPNDTHWMVHIGPGETLVSRYVHADSTDWTHPFTNGRTRASHEKSSFADKTWANERMNKKKWYKSANEPYQPMFEIHTHSHTRI